MDGPERLVRLSLRGVKFLLSSSTFESYPESLLGRAFSATMQMRPTSLMDDDAFFFNRDPELFQRVILPFYQYGLWEWRDADEPSILYQELEYWGLAPIALPHPGQDLGSIYKCQAWKVVAAMNEENARCPKPWKLASIYVVKTWKHHKNYLKTIALLRGFSIHVAITTRGEHEEGPFHIMDFTSVDEGDHPVFHEDLMSNLVPMKEEHGKWTCSFKTPLPGKHQVVVGKEELPTGDYWWCSYHPPARSPNTYPEAVDFTIFAKAIMKPPVQAELPPNGAESNPREVSTRAGWDRIQLFQLGTRDYKADYCDTYRMCIESPPPNTELIVLPRRGAHAYQPSLRWQNPKHVHQEEYVKIEWCAL